MKQNRMTYSFLAFLSRHYAKVIAFVLLIALSCLFIVVGLIGICAHTNMTEMDTAAYLGNAIEIRQLGFFGFIGACFSGNYTSANRHPLYMLLISPVAAKTIHSFIAAKIVTFVIGFIFVVVFYVALLRRYGIAVAAISTACVAASATFLSLATMVACEALLIFFVFLSWFFTVAGFQKRIYWLLAGAMSACVYLTKATGLLVLPIFILSVALRYRRQSLQLLKDKYFWGFFLAFFIVASPLLVRNAVVYHDPFYNVNRHYLWMDSWQETYLPDFGQNLPALGSYLQRHPPKEIAEIFLKGIFGRGPQLLNACLKPFPFWQKNAQYQLVTSSEIMVHSLWSVFIVVFALFGLWKVRKNDEFVVSLCWIIAVFLSVSWYSKMMLATRFMAPIAPLFFIYAALGASSLVKFFVKMVRHKHALVSLKTLFALFTVAFFVWVFITVSAGYPLNKINIAQSYGLPKNFNAVIVWLQKNIKNDEHYFLGNVYLEQFFYFEGLVKGSPHKWPQFESLVALKDYIKANDIRYGMLDVQSFVYRYQIFKGHFGFNKVAGLVPLKKIDGFKIVAADPTLPRFFVVMQFQPEEF